VRRCRERTLPDLWLRRHRQVWRVTLGDGATHGGDRHRSPARRHGGSGRSRFSVLPRSRVTATMSLVLARLQAALRQGARARRRSDPASNRTHCALAQPGRYLIVDRARDRTSCARMAGWRKPHRNLTSSRAVAIHPHQYPGHLQRPHAAARHGVRARPTCPWALAGSRLSLFTHCGDTTERLDGIRDGDRGPDTRRRRRRRTQPA
jgi:hypothetical protein